MEAHGFPAEKNTGVTGRLLLQIYLLRRAFSPHGAPPPNWIRDKVMYGEDANPWDVFPLTDHWWRKGDWCVTYANTQLSARRRILPRRSAGSGHWKRVDNQDNGQVWHQDVSLGTRTCFRFYPGDQSVHTNRTGLWVMWEYVLNSAVASNWVLCRIGRNDNLTLIGHPVPPPSPPAPPEALDEDEDSPVESPSTN